MAKLGEWTGRPSEALGYWLKLLQQQDGPQVREHAWRLAAQLFDFDNTIQLLAGAGQSRQLSDAELDALVYSHGQRGTPEQAERWLRRYLSAHPDHSWPGNASSSCWNRRSNSRRRSRSGPSATASSA